MTLKRSETEARPATIWKFPLEMIEGAQAIQLPYDSLFLHFGFQGRSPMLWFRVQPDNAMVSIREFHIVGTGWELPEESGMWTHQGTALVGEFVWHLFENRLAAQQWEVESVGP